MRIFLPHLGALVSILSACFIGGTANAAETFCVDNGKEWLQAEHLHQTMWKDPASEQIVGFFWKDPGPLKWWPPGTELGLFWPPLKDLDPTLPEATKEKLKELQAIKATFTEATKEEGATVTFDRILVKLASDGEYRDNLTQRWRYLLRFSEDCQSMSGEVAMFKHGQTDLNNAVQGRATLLREQ